jgi:sugar-phosphatase
MTEVEVRALLLDLDGTLVDSTAAVARCWTRMAGRLGIDPATIVGKYHGMPASRALALIDPTLPPDELHRISRELLADETADTDGVVALPGALDLLAALPDGAWAIVTSCTVELAHARLGAAGLPVPPVLVTSDQVPAGKPDPAPYVEGAARLGLPTSACLVVEDAPAGVTSGLAAGCRVVGVRTTHDDLEVETVADPSGLRVEVRPDGRLAVSW